MKPKQLHYFESLAQELQAQEDRIRDLIGSKHWLTDGHHKEALLRGLVERHCPRSMTVGHGFILSDDGGRTCSREQDLLILDTFAEMPLFSFTGTVIASNRLLAAAISVKTQFAAKELRDALSCLDSIPSSALDGSSHWLGIFFYQARAEAQLRDIAKTVLDGVSTATQSSISIRIGPDVFARCTRDAEVQRVRVYKCAGLSTAYFVAGLLDLLAQRRGTNFTAFTDTLDANDAAAEMVELTGPRSSQPPDSPETH